MAIKVKHGQIILIADSKEKPELLTAVRAFDGHAVSIPGRSDVCLVLEGLGLRAEACCEPINITMRVDQCHAAISNLSPDPFILDNGVTRI